MFRLDTVDLKRLNDFDIVSVISKDKIFVKMYYNDSKDPLKFINELILDNGSSKRFDFRTSEVLNDVFSCDFLNHFVG